ncbi:restriction endonuclease subunit S [Synechocystis sp. LEGE 06083]|uniref:restriction endonuclease subunit S n=1 Tax=Synechocystis sp. LEGE 06083 TaxID=915336 RepID=UPI00187F2865|nr:restriction endonuclease subunit S [Synechocystis sp. LEGE 06083]MBE9194345.1 restriction endonuclease subunit S [Synechocystis sp. LEGE 06083]
MKLKPYPEYKDSGVSWLGQIPAHWDIKPGFAFLSERKEKNTGMKESTVLSLSYGQIVVKPPEKLHGLVPESFETYQIAEPGNIIIRGTDLQNDKVSLRVGKVRNRGIITSAYLCLQTREKFNSDYAHLLLHGYDLMKIYYGMGSGLRQNLSFSDFKRLPVLVPSESEQSKINKYLQSIQVQINKFIRNKRRLIELLKEQKQNIINQAVTCGLDPNVNLKPSGVEWIGDIPEHWQVRRLKFLCDIQTGGKDTVDRKESGKYPFFVRSQTVECIDSYSFDGEAVLTAGDGAGVAKVFHYMNGKFDYHQRVYKFSSFKNIDGKLFFHYFSNTLCFEAFRGTAKSTVDSLRLPMLQNFPVLLPPLHEQKNIVLHIEYEIAAIDQVIVRAEREIELIQEYRTRLISDVVTGQVDVRDIEVPEITEEDLLILEDDNEVVDDDLVQEEDE